MYLIICIHFRSICGFYWGIILIREIPDLIFPDIILEVLHCSIQILIGAKIPCFNAIPKLCFSDMTTQVYILGSKRIPSNIIPRCSFCVITDRQGIIVVQQDVLIVWGYITLLGWSHPDARVI